MGSRFYSERNQGGRGFKIVNRAKRPKTFKTEDAAKKYAESKGIKDYKLVNLKNEESSSKKIKIVAK